MIVLQKRIVQAVITYAFIGLLTSIIRIELIFRLIPEEIRGVARISGYTTIIISNGVLIVTVLSMFFVVWHLLKLRKINLTDAIFSESVGTMIIILAACEIIKLCFTSYYLIVDDFSVVKSIPFVEQLEKSTWMRLNRIIDVFAALGGSIGFVTTLDLHIENERFSRMNQIYVFLCVLLTFASMSVMTVWQHL